MSNECTRYSIRKNGSNGSIGIKWAPLDPRWAEGSLYGTAGRYVILGHHDKPYTQFLRNPFAKPLLSNGGKS